MATTFAGTARAGKRAWQLAIGFVLGGASLALAADPGSSPTHWTLAQAQAASPTQAAPFDLSRLPVSSASLGDFPYLSAPKDTSYGNRGGAKVDFDVAYVVIDGRFIQVEGPWFGANLRADRGTKWAEAFVRKSYDEIIRSLGGVRVFHGSVPKAEIDRVKDEPGFRKSEGNFDYWNKPPISTYVIRKGPNAAVYIQLQTNTAGGSIQVAQTGEFEQSIQLLSAADLEKAIDATGKAVVHVHFDVDKAHVQPEGLKAIAEIAEVLRRQPELRLSIEGHTDNTGGAEHNQQLSRNRAQTVNDVLVLGGVAGSRLKTSGHGASKPVLPNDSEENKAQNRRVELVRF